MKNPIKGGVGDDKEIKKLNPKQMLMGIIAEKEHTPNLSVAADIAKDHLTEHDQYYTGLKNMEGKLEKLEKAKNSPKFESCVMQVKEKSPDVNPWAVCNASLKKSLIKRSRKNLEKSYGWTEDDLLKSVKEAKMEESLQKSDAIDIKTRLRVKAKRSSDVTVRNKFGHPVTVSFSFRPVKKLQEENPGSLHHILPSDDHATALLGHSGLLNTYLKENALLEEANARGFNHITMHIPGSQA